MPCSLLVWLRHKPLPIVAMLSLASTCALVLRTHGVMPAWTKSSSVDASAPLGTVPYVATMVVTSSLTPPLPPPSLPSAPPPSPSSPPPAASDSAASSLEAGADDGARSPARGSTIGAGGAHSPPIIVGLNRRVYQNDKERRYVCPRLQGRGCVFTSERSSFGKAHALIDVLKDPRKARALDFRTAPGQLKGVIISEQDAAKRGSLAFKRNAYDFEIGYNQQTATVWRPFLCNELNRRTNWTIADALLAGPPRRRAPSWQGIRAEHWPAQQPAVAAFVSNCVGWRLNFLRELRQHVPIDSFGACLHNNDTCPKGGKHKCDKVLHAGGYKFVFAFENTEESHYVTEKVYTGLRSGAVPIYKGAPEVLASIFGRPPEAARCH